MILVPAFRRSPSRKSNKVCEKEKQIEVRCKELWKWGTQKGSAPHSVRRATIFFLHLRADFAERTARSLTGLKMKNEIRPPKKKPLAFRIKR